MNPFPASPIRSLFILGGARSGKSFYAQRLAETSGLRPVMIATAEAHDAEMAERIARHKSERGPLWGLVETPLALCETLEQNAHPASILLVDCATLWLSNLFFHEAEIDTAVANLTATILKLSGPLIIVSNEVGQGIVPDNALARKFRDAQGRLNQALAQVCEGVVLVSAGLPLTLKPAPQPAPLWRF
ncbi:bifunctional adenosylcobinamide kinase/adenosylcobinamide-phosphate guanylyltransferase [Beijerinckia indica]|uniref:Bifunctional adenosylcobalamin biosynthesis protein n=1 Tax=Beijerinckia indica subsp. indica (strain ATCC 9039 / DSM 1715 / NCIMB 8712) TaxID=395963 RepID=B2IG78_BEII9|nr:bifunctional adenosylcobinamide kinase/adenosylcobinamide-phosphate guanylyltransferase [Beijerinckia indica]ACB97152.1 cobalbumin biosynthesis protein [Beijerinckia indica subsp. indica ATCC 9039]